MSTVIIIFGQMFVLVISRPGSDMDHLRQKLGYWVKPKDYLTLFSFFLSTISKSNLKLKLVKKQVYCSGYWYSGEHYRAIMAILLMLYDPY